jgi:hypothetical protein
LDVIEIQHPDRDACRYIRNFLVDAYAINELRLVEDFESAKAFVERPIEQELLCVHRERGVLTLDGSRAFPT